MLASITSRRSDRSMPIDAGDPLRDAQSLEAAVDDALAGLIDEDHDEPTSVDYRWLGVGMRLGLERPDQARHLLELIGAGEVDRSAVGDTDAVAGSPGVTADERPGDATSVPVRSLLLARDAAVPFAERASSGTAATFGWAAMLTRGEVQLLGRVVHQQLAAGAPADIGRGFGLAWDGGVRLPRRELDQLFREFTELEMTVAGALAGRDLRSEPTLGTDRAGGLLGQRIPRARPGEAQAAAALESSGEPGKLGLVATWNAWMAVRYRTLIPSATFELLVHPWVTVVGSLPA
jgi:hypothetical protein